MEDAKLLLASRVFSVLGAFPNATLDFIQASAKKRQKLREQMFRLIGFLTKKNTL